ncbi:MAG: ABC transporter substrate-binding protein [Planctomycetes bacterium]|nr:ABC transporter substrate-binding protein [Planctomycetota bacterium]
MTRRAALGTLAAGSVGYALLGPRGAKEDTRGRLVLDYWEKWTGLEGKVMQEVVAEFNKSQDRLFVRYFATSGIDEKAQIAIAGGSPPDIVGVWNYSVPAFASANAILPLDDLGAPLGIKPEIYAEGMRQVVTFRGKMWATVNTGGCLALYYNRSHFKEVGLDPDSPPRTFPEFDDACRKLLIKKNGRIQRMGFHHREPGWWSFIWGSQFGGTLYDEKTNTSTAASPLNVRGYEWVQSTPKEYGLAEVNDFRTSFGNYDSALNAFVAGRLSMVVQGPWLANIIKLYNDKLDYGVAPFPVAEGMFDKNAPMGLIDTDTLVIPRGVKNPEASMEFVAYTQRQDVVERLSTVHCKGSPLAQSSESFRKNHPNRGIAVFEAIARSPRSYKVPATRCWAAMKDEMDRALDRVWNMQDSPASILGLAQKRSQAILDLTAEQERRRRGGAP